MGKAAAAAATTTTATSKLFHREYYRWIILMYALISTGLAAGVVYGWPAYRRVLIAEGTLLTEVQLNTIFTIGSWSTIAGRFFLGISRDRTGTRITGCFSLACATAGAIGLGVSDKSNLIGLSISMLLMGLGSGIQLCLQPIAIYFPNHKGVVVSSISGSFLVSGLVFLVLTSISSNRRLVFCGFATVLAMLLGIAIVLLPRGKFGDEIEKTENEKEKDCTKEQDQELKLDRDASAVMMMDTAEEDSFSPFSGMMIPLELQKEEKSLDAEPTAIQQMKTLEYVGLIFWFSTTLIPIQYYIATLGYQLEQKGDSEGQYTNLFLYLYASSALLSPLAGRLADKFGMGIAQATATILTASSFFVLASNVPLETGQVLGLVLHSIGRMMDFGMYFTNLGIRFGFTNYGTLLGVGLLVSGTIGLLQTPLIVWSTSSPSSSQWVNLACGIVLLCLLPYCIWLSHKETQQQTTATSSSSSPPPSFSRLEEEEKGKESLSAAALTQSCSNKSDMTNEDVEVSSLEEEVSV